MKLRLALFFLLSLGCIVRAEYKELTKLKKFSKDALKEYSERLSNVDPKFEGVVNFGKALKRIEDEPDVSIAELTVESRDYWRAVLEMVPTDPSILFAHGYLHTTRGETAYAEIYFMLGSMTMGDEFSGELEEYRNLKAELDKRVEREISKGARYHDKKKYSKALDCYDAVIAEYPNCAWAFYEKGFTYMMMGRDNTELEKQRQQMYSQCRRCDPFYLYSYQGSDQKILDKLMVLGTKVYPFISGEKRDIEAFKAFAEGCEEMELYSFAAHAHWKLIHFDTDNMKDHIRKFLDLLPKSGCKEADFFRSQFNLEEDNSTGSSKETSIEENL
jgi:tetratricopeptide (TPR) repeat protein